jgi:hypothetical protein
MGVRLITHVNYIYKILININKHLKCVDFKNEDTHSHTHKVREESAIKSLLSRNLDCYLLRLYFVIITYGRIILKWILWKLGVGVELDSSDSGWGLVTNYDHGYGLSDTVKG